MTPDQLRQSLRELSGDRDCTIAFSDVFPAGGGVLNNALLEIRNAMLIPDEPDHMVKVTDGKHIYVIDADRVVWVRIALKQPVK
ncbi:MAG TPA: hypothetical protein VK176_05995 [Phycisphaerales bacterium]|jgi:hypothetical protein|nr:hypothetical protein [Phycisphaerales bacterium]